MTGSHEAIKRVVEAFERSDWTEIDVRAGDVRVHLAAGAATTSAPTPEASPGPAATAVGERATAAPATPGAPAAVELPDGAHVVTAPSPGIYWRSPEPGAPPFADLGATVEPGTTVCIIEVMKLMNHLKAGVAGEVVAVYGRDGVAVRKGEPLFAIAPSAS